MFRITFKRDLSGVLYIIIIIITSTNKAPFIWRNVVPGRKVTRLAGPTFLHINTLARLAGSTPSRRNNQSTPEGCWPGKGVNSFLT